jgi:hypothetical protein
MYKTSTAKITERGIKKQKKKTKKLVYWETEKRETNLYLKIRGPYDI